jgi:hypothetical protein
MYTVIFEQNGEAVATHTMHAADEEDARRRCEALSCDHPQGEGVGIRVELTKLPGAR